MSYSISPKEAKEPISTSATTRTLDVVTQAKARPHHIDSTVPPQGASLPPLGTPQGSTEVDAVEPLNAKEPADPRIQELERKELALRETARQIAKDKAELVALKATTPKAMTAAEWKAQFMTDPKSVGIEYQEMADKYLTQPTESDQKYADLQAEIAELKAQQGNSEKAIKDAQAQAYNNVVKQMKAETVRLVESSPQDYEMISAQGQHDAVVALIEATYADEQVLMSPKQAADKVEEYLLNRALKVAGLNKVKAKISPTAPAADQADPKTPRTMSTPTLSHSMAASKPQSARERAIAAFNAKHNK